METLETPKPATQRAPNPVSRRNALVWVGGVLGALLLYMTAMTVLSDARVVDPGPARGTISYAPARTVEVNRFLAGGALALAAFSPNGVFAATYGRDATAVEVRRISDGTLAATIPASGLVRLLFSPDGSTLVADDASGAIFVWRAADGTAMLPKLEGLRGPLAALIISNDGQRIQAAAPDGTLALWQLSDGRPLRRATLEPFSGAVAFSGDGRFMAHITSAGIRVFDLDKNQERNMIDAAKGDYATLAFSHLGGLIAATQANGAVELYQSRVGDPIYAFQPPAAPTEPGPAGAFNADARLFAGALPNGDIMLWDVRRGGVAATIKGHSAQPIGFGFTDDGSQMFSADAAGEIRVWRAGE